MRHDWHFARLLQMIHNVMCGEKGQKDADAFLLKFTEAKAQRQTPQLQEVLFRLMAQAQAASVDSEQKLTYGSAGS